MFPINLDKFISDHITCRNESFFLKDIANNSETLRKEIENKSVLVIGGGGTIGSSFIRSVLAYKPSKVVVVDTNENGLTELVRSIRSTPNLIVPETFITYPVNFGDAIFEKIYHRCKPFDIVANFAAHKHVRSEKDIFSIEAMIQNNVFYAWKLLNLIEHDKPSHFFCVSTDKAANPINIMGATKKLMEDIVMQYSASIKCTTARFANVAFSNGSLLDGFLPRLMQGQPLSVPADVKRYFVSPKEAAEICMLACVLGESGDIFYPKLHPDQLTGFLDITISFLHELGYEIDECSTEDEAKQKSLLLNNESKNYPVYVFNSDTTGEKLYEEFFAGKELLDLNTYESLGVVKKSNSSTGNITAAVKEIETLFKKPGAAKNELIEILKNYIPTFEHLEKGMTLDKKM